MADNDIARLKQDIRTRVLGIRDHLGHAEMLRMSLSVQSRLSMMPEWKAARHICTFIGSRPGEISTLGLIQAALNAGKPVCVPVIDSETRELYLSPVTDTANLVRGHFDILEPGDAPRHAIDDLDWDLALVPGVAFDRDGNRIGFGKGYYDRLLSSRTTLRIALAFGFQVLDSVPSLPHDIPVDMIVTERETIRTA